MDLILTSLPLSLFLLFLFNLAFTDLEIYNRRLRFRFRYQDTLLHVNLHYVRC